MCKIYYNEKILSRRKSQYTYTIIIKYDIGEQLGDHHKKKGRGKLAWFVGNRERVIPIYDTKDIDFYPNSLYNGTACFSNIF